MLARQWNPGSGQRRSHIGRLAAKVFGQLDRRQFRVRLFENPKPLQNDVLRDSRRVARHFILYPAIPTLNIMEKSE